MRIVVDTNCLLASISKKSKHFWLYEAFIAKKFIWLLSTEILMEYEEIIGEFYSSTTANIVLKILTSSTNIELLSPHFKLGLITKDPDDNKFSDLAISSNADFLISNDKHFNIFKKIKFPPLSVLRIEEFKKIMDLDFSNK